MSSSSSSSSHAIVMYTSVSSDDDLPSWGIPLMEAYEPEAPLLLVHALVYLEYLAPSGEDIAPAKDQLLPAPALPTTLSLGYIAKSFPIEDGPEDDLEIDPVDYPSDEEEEESFEEEEEEPLALALSASPVLDSVPSYEETEPFEEGETVATLPPPVSLHTTVPLSQTGVRKARKTVRPQSPLPPSIAALIEDRCCWTAYVYLARGTKLDFMTALEEVKESVTDIAARHRQDSEEFHTPQQAWTHFKDCICESQAKIRVLQAKTRALQQQRRDDHDIWTSAIGHIQTLEITRDPKHPDESGDADMLLGLYHIMAPKRSNMSEASINKLVAQSVADALAEYEANRNSGNGNGNGNKNGTHDSKASGGRTPHTTRECTYSEFLKSQPLNFKGTEGALGLAQWFEKMESVFHISKCTVEWQVKFATCTLLGGALTWWNSHVRIVEHDAAYALPWKAVMKMITENYYPKSELKKLETELWNLVMKATDVESYTQRFQELILMCSRMVPDELDKVQKYTSGLPDSIQGSVMASKPITLQEAIELIRSLMDQKLLNYAARQAENKMRLDNNSRNNNAQHPPNKRQNVARAYTAGSGEKREYARTLPLCNKCKFHHNGPCTAKAPGTIQKTGTCFKCGSQGHFKRDCPKLKNQNRGNAAGNGKACGRAYALGGGDPNPDLNVVTGLYFKLVKSPVHLMPVELGSFDAIIGKDLLSKYHDVIVCDEKIVRISYGDEVLIVQGDKSDSRNES
uniref:CCHC-type domain-containing protein n=1 Tax=Tanacetum cinerariifolium TaxID=118510 RepID=A0A699HAG9_TANCI|nr:hypothetical protein [Tanacetum cinerariifolium]